MGWWQVNADTLAGSRFVISPLAETTASLKTLEREHAATRASGPGSTPTCPPTGRLADDPITALLVRAALGGTGTRTSSPPRLGDASSVRGGAGAGPRDAGRDRPRGPEVSLGGPLPALLRPVRPARTGRRPAGVGVDGSVLPYWPRRRRIIEADIVARTAQLSQGGWAAALDDMRPGMRWLGEGRLQINAYDYPPREISGAQLLFVPVTPGHGWVSWDARTGTRWSTRARAPWPRPDRPDPRRWAPARPGPGGRARPAGLPEEHDAAGGADRPGAGLGGPPPQGPARRPSGAAGGGPGGRCCTTGPPPERSSSRPSRTVPEPGVAGEPHG